MIYQLSHINIQNSIALDWFLDNHDSVDDDDDGEDDDDDDDVDDTLRLYSYLLVGETTC